ncbi:acyl-CoA dehydrogenase family protein [Bradyrhizobium brasilense]|uniref:acyl-CoA dehydrogenase family protein n=1 Tax=Bradyrhizobium brasilense TaxID=1419277 RepID=UPI0024B174E4|nr:acyl-CoA dehydrogenase family protein [Bradyrhizobium australafricanum]WFU31336.1 acyl-CoA dehydrogenase family protein [Bradyrhizobium australafricanum]
MYEFKGQTQALVELVHKIVKDHQEPLEQRKLRGEDLFLTDYEPGRDAARRAGLWGLSLPAEFGGANLSLVDRLAVMEENRKCLTPILFGGEVPRDLLHLRDEQRARYLDPILSDAKRCTFAFVEPEGGSDPSRKTATYAKRKDNGWVIDGSKSFVSGWEDADLVFVLAKTSVEESSGNLSMFAVEKGNPGLIADGPVRMLGGLNSIDRGTYTTTYRLIFRNCRVDDLARIGAEGAGFKGAQDALSWTRFGNAAAATGIALRCFDMMVKQAKQRMLFGGPLGEKQAIQSIILDSWIEIQQHRLMMYKYAEKVDRGDDTRVEAAVTKLTCTEMVGRIIDRAIQIHGGAGCSYESPLAHWYDKQRMARVYEGATEVLKYRALARRLLA